MPNQAKKKGVLLPIAAMLPEERAKIVDRLHKENKEASETKKRNEFFAEAVEDTIKGLLLALANSPQADKILKRYGIQCTTNIALWASAIMTKGIDNGDADALLKLLQVLDIVTTRHNDNASNSKVLKVLNSIREGGEDAARNREIDANVTD